MFRLKTDAYSYLILFLSHSNYRNNVHVSSAIKNIKIALENHEDDIEKVLKNLQPIFHDSEISSYFKSNLSNLKYKIKTTDFTKASLQEKFENPLRRQLDSLMAINMLNHPTKLMMSSVNKISERITGILKNYDNLNQHEQNLINRFLESLENLKGQSAYQSVISLGSFKSKPSIKDVINLLKSNDDRQLAAIMHAHFKFSLLVSREIRLSTTPNRKPVGKFKDIIDSYLGENNYGNYFNEMASTGQKGRIYSGFLPDQVIYASQIYKADSTKGKKGDLDYSNLTNTLGLMLNNQQEYEKVFPKMDLPWVADAKAQKPKMDSRVTLDLLEHEAIYVAGPSGMASLFLHIMENMGNFSSISEKQSYLAAICAYIVGGGFHSFPEVLAPAAFSLDLIPNYAVSAPDVENNKLGPTPKVNSFFAALAKFDKEFQKLNKKSWGEYLNFCDKYFLDKISKVMSEITFSQLLCTVESACFEYQNKVGNKPSFFNNIYYQTKDEVNSARELLNRIKTDEGMRSKVKKDYLIHVISSFLQDGPGAWNKNSFKPFLFNKIMSLPANTHEKDLSTPFRP